MNGSIVAALAAALLATAACAVMAPVETKTYDLSDFDSISASAGVNVSLKQGAFSVTAEGPRSRLDKLVVEREGEELIIRREPTVSWGVWSQSDLVTVVAPAYSGIKASGGADVSGDGLQLGDLEVRISGGADIHLSGSCKTLTLDASGGAGFRGKDLACESASVSASGGADVAVAASRDASGSGSGGADISFYGVAGAAIGKATSGADIRFHGKPATTQLDESSGGDIHVSDD